MKKYFLVAAALMGAIPAARGEGFGDLLRSTEKEFHKAGKEILSTVDCSIVCQKKLCGIQNFKDFCEILCSKEDDVKKCKEVGSYPFIFEKGRVALTPIYQTLLVTGEKALSAFCQVRCNRSACKDNKQFAALCIKSCAPDTVVNCKAASGL